MMDHLKGKIIFRIYCSRESVSIEQPLIFFKEITDSSHRIKSVKKVVVALLEFRVHTECTFFLIIVMPCCFMNCS